MSKEKETIVTPEKGDSAAKKTAAGGQGVNENRGNRKKNDHLYNILAAAAVVCVLIGGLTWYKTRSGTDVYAKIQESSIEEPAKAPAQTSAQTSEEKTGAEEKQAAATAASAASTTASAAPAEEIPIDFETLWQTCPDAYAWIRIPNTQVDYPVCQMVEGDQGFYLNHRADKVAEFAGAIYSENYNTRDFTDPVTVLYGHDMNNGSMFQNLHFYEDRAFFEQNKDVIIYLPDRVLHYKIFAAYNYNDDHLLLNNDCFKDPNVFNKFLQEILAQKSMTGFVDQNTELTAESRILTLSTCNAYDDQRYLVQCLLMNPEVLPKVETAAQSTTSEEAQTGR